MLDHATGFVVGETATIGDNVLDPAGRHARRHRQGRGGPPSQDRQRRADRRRRHRLGNIKVGDCARIGAGSVVVKEVPPRVTVVGVPARIVGEAGARSRRPVMDQMASPTFRLNRTADFRRQLVLKKAATPGLPGAHKLPIVAHPVGNDPCGAWFEPPRDHQAPEIPAAKFSNRAIDVRPRNKQNDSVEVYLGEEFLGLIYVDDEDGDRSYNFQMAILDVDLAEIT
jgi:hypothetical protein